MERKELADVLVRALFYYGLEDSYLQIELSKIREDASLDKFFVEACRAESNRRSYQQIGKSSAQLDASAGVSVARWDSNPKYKGFHKKPDKSVAGSEPGNKKPATPP